MLRPSLKTTAFAATLALSLAALAYAAPSKGTYTDAKEAGDEYTSQGEFVGEYNSMKIGVQIIALGDGKVRVVSYHGGLPGDGWNKESKKEKEPTFKTENGTTTYTHGENHATLSGDTLKVFEKGTQIAELKRVERKSPTLGAKPPAGAIVLFDGKSADNFKGGKMTDDGLLRVGCETKQKFGDYTLHLEFRLPFQPKDRGQGRGNSGMYIGDCYEVQVLDSFGLKGENNECGGLYTLKAPDVNMCFPPLAWQTYDVDYTAARFEGDKKVKNAILTVKHNGVVIHDKYELPKACPGRQGEGPGPRQISLQDHGNPVVYRNIWLVEKK